jgi:hypothetical protein
VVFVGGPVLVYGFTQADRLVRAEHEFHRDAWERDGAPCGFFCMPAGCRTRVPFKWLFRTPPWVLASPEYSSWLRRYRICALTWNIMCAPIFLGMMYSFIHQHV